MKKNEILSTITIAFSGLLYLIYNVVNLIIDLKDGVNSTWVDVGALLYTVLLVIALVYAIVEKRYLAGLAVTALKITFPYGNLFYMPLFRWGVFNLDAWDSRFYFIFGLLMVLTIVATIIQLNNNNFVGQKYSFKSFLGRFMVLVFLLMFSDFNTAVISSLAEVISFLLLAVMTSEFLFLSVFITVPFDFAQKIALGLDVEFNDVLYLVVGVGLLGHGIYALIAHIQHAKHDHAKHDHAKHDHAKHDHAKLVH